MEPRAWAKKIRVCIRKHGNKHDDTVKILMFARGKAWGLALRRQVPLPVGRLHLPPVPKVPRHLRQAVCTS